MSLQMMKLKGGDHCSSKYSDHVGLTQPICSLCFVEALYLQCVFQACTMSICMWCDVL
uniref:Uncharacterized protein n=1 Tax=Arundo donax TaxID=35708 RepID=A0A0A8ZWI7_ARUDO